MWFSFSWTKYVMYIKSVQNPDVKYKKQLLEL